MGFLASLTFTRKNRKGGQGIVTKKQDWKVLDNLF
jgi:hypothetical protein